MEQRWSSNGGRAEEQWLYLQGKAQGFTVLLSPEIRHIFTVCDMPSTHSEEMGSLKLAVDNAIERFELLGKIDEGKF